MTSPEYSRNYYLANRQRILDYQKHYYSENGDYVRKRTRGWYGRNRTRLINGVKRRADGMRVEIRNYTKQHYRKNSEVYKQRAHLRAKLIRSARWNLKRISEWMESVKSKSSFECYYCQQRFPSSTVNFDHIIPLSKGGPHSVENLCSSCPKCNREKSDKLIGDWDRKGQQIFEV